MNKEAKQFLILWILWCLISALFIFYDDIFPEKNDNIPPTPIVNQDINNKTKDLILKENQKYSWNLNIVLPSFFYVSWFDLLATTLHEQYGFDVAYSFINTIDEYTDILKNQDNYDIILLPTDILEWQAFDRINLWEDITPFFDSLFTDLLKERADFIPFAIDPLITLYHKNTNINTTDISSLVSYVLFWEQEDTHTIPLLWWIGANDLLFLKSNKEIFENYFSILYYLIYWFSSNRDDQGLKNIIELNQKATNNSYSTKKFLSLKNSLISTNNYCEIYPGICVFALDYADIKFWFLSDLDIIKSKFSDTNITNILVNSFPNFDNIADYKVRWWGFVSPVNEDTKQQDLKTLFFYEYLKNAMNDNYNIIKDLYTLPAIANNNKKYNFTYKNILALNNNFDLIFNDLNTQTKFISDKKVLNLLEWDYDAKKFIQDFQRDW